MHRSCLRKLVNPLLVCMHETKSNLYICMLLYLQKGQKQRESLIFVFVCVRQKQSIILPCRVLTLQGCAVTCWLINSVLSVVRLVPTAPTAMIKREALKGWETLPIHSRYFLDAVHTQSTISL